jgi:transcriptional regulator with XRE-family HTH domain
VELNSVGRRVAFLRFLGGITASGLSKLAGLSHATIAKIESNDSDPQSSVIGKIAKVTGASADWLISGTGDLPEEASVRAAIAAAQGSSEEPAAE